MSKRFVYTELAEEIAKRHNLKSRKAGTTARCAGEPLKDGQMARRWMAKGYVVEVTK